MKKHIRQLLRALRTELPECEVTILRTRVHHVLELKRGDKSRRLAVATSPKNVDHAVMNSLKEAKQLAAEMS